MRLTINHADLIIHKCDIRNKNTNSLKLLITVISSNQVIELAELVRDDTTHSAGALIKITNLTY